MNRVAGEGGGRGWSGGLRAHFPSVSVLPVASRRGHLRSCGFRAVSERLGGRQPRDRGARALGGWPIPSTAGALRQSAAPGGAQPRQAEQGHGGPSAGQARLQPKAEPPGPCQPCPPCPACSPGPSNSPFRGQCVCLRAGRGPWTSRANRIKGGKYGKRISAVWRWRVARSGRSSPSAHLAKVGGGNPLSAVPPGRRGVRL